MKGRGWVEETNKKKSVVEEEENCGINKHKGGLGEGTGLRWPLGRRIWRTH